MRQAVKVPTDSVLLVVTALTSCLAGIAFVTGAMIGRGWETALALVGLMVLGAAWRDERLLLALFALSFLTVSHPSLRLPMGRLWIPLPAAIAGVMCARELVVRLSARSAAWPALPVVSLSMLFAGFLVSGFAVVDPAAYVADLGKWVAHTVVFIAVILALRRREWVYGLTDALAVVVGVLAAFGLYRVASGLSADIDVFSGVASRSAASFHITAVLPILYARLLGSTGARRIGRFALFATLVVGQVFTYTRAGWLATAASLVFVSGRRLRAYLLMAIALGVLVATVPPEVRDRFLSIFVVADFGVDRRLASSTVVREHLLMTGLETIRDNWLIGVGLGNYFDTYHRYAIPGSPAAPHTPHCSFLYLWAEAGILSVAGFLWFYGSRLWLVWNTRDGVAGSTRPVLLGLAGSLVGMAVEACFEDDLNLILTWTILGMSTALADIARRKPQ